MKTKARGGGSPFADDPWNEIVDGLWMGGHFFVVDGMLTPVVADASFDVVVSLYHRDGHGPPAETEEHYLDIPDGPLSNVQLDAVCRLGEVVQSRVRAGQRVLVRCHAGYNRSGLVIAHALVLGGHDVNDVIDLIRRRRSRWALSNELFVDYLVTGLDVAGLLSGLSVSD